MTNDPYQVGDYTEQDCANTDCDRMVTIHVDQRGDGIECVACDDEKSLDPEEANATFPKTNDS